MQNLVSQWKAPIAFFASTFLLSAPLYILNALANYEVLGSPHLSAVYISLLTLTPILAASLIEFRKGGFGDLKKLLSRILDFNRITQKRWWVIALLLGPLIFILSVGWMAVSAQPVPPSMVPVAALPAVLAFAFVLAAGEETGWMTHAAEPLQAHFGALSAALILGSVWALWHVPFFLFFFPDLIVLGAQLLTLVGARVILVWVFNNAGGSVFAVILYHAADNTAFMVLPDIKIVVPDGAVVHCVFTLVAALAIALIWEPKTLGRLRGRI